MSETVLVKNAIIKEVKVTVKNVIIGKRQLTQRVFRQIQVAEVVDWKTGKLKGQIWGYINYFWPDNKFYKHHHRHLLWVTNTGEMRRCYLEASLKSWDNHKYANLIKSILTIIPQLYIAV